jgi:DNA-binding NarL/FixJ family response regulator
MQTQRIFLVDDHELVRLGLNALINRHPQMAVVGEASSAKAVALAQIGNYSLAMRAFRKAYNFAQ